MVLLCYIQPLALLIILQVITNLKNCGFYHVGDVKQFLVTFFGDGVNPAHVLVVGDLGAGHVPAPEVGRRVESRPHAADLLALAVGHAQHVRALEQGQAVRNGPTAG